MVDVEVKYAAVPTCFTPFVIVAAKHPTTGKAGFIARWSHQSSRVEVRDACQWRPTRDAVRNTMAYIFADVQEARAR